MRACLHSSVCAGRAGAAALQAQRACQRVPCSSAAQVLRCPPNPAGQAGMHKNRAESCTALLARSASVSPCGRLSLPPECPVHTREALKDAKLHNDACKVRCAASCGVCVLQAHATAPHLADQQSTGSLPARRGASVPSAAAAAASLRCAEVCGLPRRWPCELRWAHASCRCPHVRSTASSGSRRCKHQAHTGAFTGLPGCACLSEVRWCFRQCVDSLCRHAGCCRA